jgi:hypothetical protein
MNKKKFFPLYTVALGEGRSLKIRPSANAWWKNQSKVHRLIALFNVGVSAEKARKNIGITKRKYDYFVKKHPEVVQMQKEYKDETFVAAAKTVRDKALKDPKFSLKYWIKKEPDKFPPPRLLRKIKLIKEWMEEDWESYQEELRELRIIVGMFQEAIDPRTKEWNKKYLERIRETVIFYNRKYRKTKLHRVKEVDALKISIPNSEQTGFPGFTEKVYQEGLKSITRLGEN